MTIQFWQKKIHKWFTTPEISSEIQRRNFINVQVDAIGVGIASAAAPFLPVFLTRLHASSFEVGLLTSMPAVTGLLLSIPLGQFLQRQRNIVPWFSLARLLVIACYALTGLITFVVKDHAAVIGILAIWAFATFPQTLLSISFNVVMNSVAGPVGRYELMTRRWSILGLTTTLTVILVGQALDRIPSFPLNYQIVFLALSAGGLISYYFSSHLNIPPQEVSTERPSSFREGLREFLHLILEEKSFVSFNLKRFVFSIGTTMAAPLFPLYFVRQLHAPDSWIATINTAQTAILILGYFLWTRQSRRYGSRRVLLATTFGVSLYPILTGITHTVWPIPFYAGLAGIFQAGLNLVFFDELMRTVPEKYSAIFVSTAQSIQYVSSIIAPFIGTTLAGILGFNAALIISGSVSILGFLLFLIDKNH
ncbi:MULTISPECIES: MFS transporter [Anaerolinea]|uniref:MFS transporter n=1 Tax=Anaerolinea TaxID=233189 RepID=UPI0026302F85|nr:MFS transporter [Anaerolinea thermophila]